MTHMKQSIALAVLLVLLLGSCACENDSEHPFISQAGKKDKTEESDKHPGGKTRKYPEMGACQVIKVKVEELSGLCMTKDSSALWAVGDEGALCKV